jgi:S-adenosylhomocysteine hydrolase
LIEKQLQNLKEIKIEDCITPADLILIPTIPGKIVRKIMRNGRMDENEIFKIFSYAENNLLLMMNILCNKRILLRKEENGKIFYSVNLKQKKKTISPIWDKLDKANEKAKQDQLFKSITDISREAVDGKYDNVESIFNLLQKNEYPLLLKNMTESFAAYIMKAEAREYHLRYKNLSQYNLAEEPFEEQGITSLGSFLNEMESGIFRVDMNQFLLLSGYDIIVKNIVANIEEQYKKKQPEIMVHYKISPEISPELLELGVSNITFYAKSSIFKGINFIKKELLLQIENVIFSIQNPRWRKILFETNSSNLSNLTFQNTSLIFPFYLFSKDTNISNLIIAEYDIDSKSLCLTIDDSEEGRLNYEHIPHRVVNDLNKRIHINNIGEIVDWLYAGIKSEAAKNNYEFTENAKRNPQFFKILNLSGFKQITDINILWQDEYRELILNQPKKYILFDIIKILLVISENAVYELLDKEQTIEMKSSDFSVYLDLSRNAGCLNISFGELRNKPSIDYHFNRMTKLKKFSLENKNAFKNTKIFFIHHSTFEVLGTIKAIEEMGCFALHTFFIKYAGVIPGKYIEIILAMDKEKFQFHGLNRVKTIHNVEGYYSLSTDYSEIQNFSYLNVQLNERKLDFLHASRLSSGNMFMRDAIQCRISGHKLLLIEDGGYLTPLINTFCKEQKTLAEVLEYFAFPLNGEVNDDHWISYYHEISELLKNITDKNELNMQFEQWLSKIYLGSVEHTRNGFDNDMNVQKKFGELAFPTVSIAISNLKKGLEAGETSVSVIHSIGSILQGLGLVISSRRAIIIGGAGAIGSKSVAQLSNKLGRKNVFCVDIAIPENANEELKFQARSFSETPREILYETDLFLGYTGKSVITEDNFQDLILKSKKEKLFFASGSTKTVEFANVFKYLNRLINAQNQRIGNRKISLEVDLIRDPLSDYLQGTKIRITFIDNKKFRDIFLLADGTPVNFLYFGIPTEIMDLVFLQLLKLSASFVNKTKKLPNKVLGLDHEIDEDANLLHPESTTMVNIFTKLN